MKSIADYLADTEGTGPAVGKTFELHGMTIGQFVGLTHPTSLTFAKNGETMEVPIAIRLEGFNLPGPIGNPLLKEIKEI